jgi:hypothetical protein
MASFGPNISFAAFWDCGMGEPSLLFLHQSVAQINWYAVIRFCKGACVDDLDDLGF